MLTDSQKAKRRVLISQFPDPNYIDQILGNEAFCLSEIDQKMPELITKAQMQRATISNQAVITTSQLAKIDGMLTIMQAE